MGYSEPGKQCAVGVIFEAMEEQRKEKELLQASDFNTKLILAREVAVKHPSSVVYFYQFNNDRWYYLSGEKPDATQCPSRVCLRVTQHGAIIPVRLKKENKSERTESMAGSRNRKM